MLQQISALVSNMLALPTLTWVAILAFAIMIMISGSFVFVLSDHKWMTKNQKMTKTIGKLAALLAIIPAIFVVALFGFKMACLTPYFSESNSCLTYMPKTNAPVMQAMPMQPVQAM